MSRAERRSKTSNFIAKQLKIAKAFGIKIIPGKLKKKHALDCGNPRCMVCGNPRKRWKIIPHKEKKWKD